MHPECLPYQHTQYVLLNCAKRFLLGFNSDWTFGLNLFQQQFAQFSRSTFINAIVLWSSLGSLTSSIKSQM